MIPWTKLIPKLEMLLILVLSVESYKRRESLLLSTSFSGDHALPGHWIIVVRRHLQFTSGKNSTWPMRVTLMIISPLTTWEKMNNISRCPALLMQQIMFYKPSIIGQILEPLITFRVDWSFRSCQINQHKYVLREVSVGLILTR